MENLPSKLKEVRKEIAALKAWAETEKAPRKVSITYENYLALLEFQEAILKRIVGDHV